MYGITIDQLKLLPVWTNWDYFQRDNDSKPTKKPRGKVNDPDTWLYYQDAEQIAHSDNCGIGLMFFPADLLHGFPKNYLLCGIDIDAHRMAQNPDAKVILQMFQATYTEKSPSGNGYHVIFLVNAENVPPNYKQSYYFKNSGVEVECYIAGLTNRYFTFTGNKLPKQTICVTDQTDNFLKFINLYMKRSAEDDTLTQLIPENITTITTGEKAGDSLLALQSDASESVPLHPADQPQIQTHSEPTLEDTPSQPIPENITTITTGEREQASLLSPTNLQNRLNAMFHAKNGAKAKALFSGSFDGLGYSSQSEAVQALCNYLVFYFGDFGADTVKEVFLSSGLASGKWSERTDIIYSTIQKAFNDCHGRYTPRSGSPSAPALTAGGTSSEEDKPKRKVIQFADFLAYVDSHGYDMKFNDITKDIDFYGFDKRESVEHLEENIPTILEDGLKQEYKGVTSQLITRYIFLLATRRKYNPVLDLITHTEWDKHDYIEDIYKMLKLSSDTLDNFYSRIFIQKWLMQCVCVLFNDPLNPFSADLVLVLQGKQGMGKTRFLEHLALSPQYFGGGMCLDPRNKDSIMQITSKWIVELGEIGSTMRKDIDLVKAFISSAVDEFRVPYGRTFTSYPRRTSIAGTVNDAEYLIDETGNRRFLTIPLDDDLKIDYETQIAPFNALQLWAQVYNLVRTKNKASCFRLSRQQEEYLIKRNKNHEKLLKGEADVLDALAEQSGANGKKQNCTYTEREMTVTEFIQHNDLRYDARQVTKILKKHGYIPENHRVNGIKGRYFKLPYVIYSSPSSS